METSFPGTMQISRSPLESQFYNEVKNTVINGYQRKPQVPFFIQDSFRQVVQISKL